MLQIVAEKWQFFACCWQRPCQLFFQYVSILRIMLDLVSAGSSALGSGLDPDPADPTFLDPVWIWPDPKILDPVHHYRKGGSKS